MTISLQFVNVGTASGGQQGALSTVDQRAIRSQAMKDFRRRQREAKKTSSVSATTQHSAQVSDGCPERDDKALQWIDLTHRYREGPDKSPSSSRQSQSSSSPPLLCVRCGACHDSASESDGVSECGSDCVRKDQSLSRRAPQISIPEAINSPAMFRGHFFPVFIHI